MHRMVTMQQLVNNACVVFGLENAWVLHLLLQIIYEIEVAIHNW